MFQGCLRNVSNVFHWCLKKHSRIFKEVASVLIICFIEDEKKVSTKILRVVHVSFEDVSNTVSRVFQRSFVL